MQEIVEQIFNIQSEEQFESTALRIFHLQANENPVYKSFLNFLRVDSNHVKTISDIPFLPISFFKTHKVLLNGMHEKLIFRSSGTTGALTSNHLVAEPEVYLKSFLLGFRNAYGNPEDFIILALLPGYLERGDSSLVYMVNHLINETKSDVSGFYLQNHQALYEALGLAAQSGRKILLIGVTHALLKFARNYSFSHENLIVMETGGMKGQGPESTHSF